MSKVEQALSIFNANPNASRKEVIELFVNQIGLTPAGAATYYSNAKRQALGGSFHQTAKTEESVDNSTDDVPNAFSVCTIVNGIVDSIEMFLSRPSKIKEGQLLTSDHVEIGQDASLITAL